MRDIFDPGQVYLWGTLEEGPCGRDAIAPVSEPNRAVIGFTCIFKDWDRYSPAISPRDGRLVYIGIGGGGSADEVLAFVGDGDGLGDYSIVAQANDLLQVTLCNDSGKFFVDPDDGEIVSACSGQGERVYSRAGGEPWELEQDYHLVHLGFGETALVSSDISDWAVKTETGEIIHPATELRSALAVRARPDGFWYATHTEGRFER